MITDPERARMSLSTLDANGVRVSIDNFGRGQTSLAYLTSLPVRELNIDRSCVYGMDIDPAHAAMVRSMIDLGHNLHLRVVGEGVENDAVLAGLREAGCDMAQGYLLARPMPLRKLERWLAEPEQPRRRRR